MFTRKRPSEMEMSVLQETFRVLKSNIQFCEKGNKIKTITITSCNPGEGKTTIALNLATSIASSGIKVLLVDAEFREKKTSRFLDAGIKLASQKIDACSSSMEEVIKETSIKNLSFLSVGVNIINPEFFIDSSQLGDFIEAVKEKFEVVIFDAPSLGGVIDSALIASHTDGVILVIQAGLHDYRTVQKAKEQLEKANAKILGVAISKVKKINFKSYFKYQKYCRKTKVKGKMELEELGFINKEECAQT